MGREIVIGGAGWQNDLMLLLRRERCAEMWYRRTEERYKRRAPRRRPGKKPTRMAFGGNSLTVQLSFKAAASAKSADEVEVGEERPGVLTIGGEGTAEVRGL